MNTRPLLNLLLFSTLLAACGGGNQAAIATGVAQAAQISQLETEVAQVAATATVPAIPTVDAAFTWAGDWYLDGDHVFISQTGNQITADVYGSSHYIIRGTLINNNQIVVGLLKYELSAGEFMDMPFQWRINPADHSQFAGSSIYPGYPQPYDWCGSRYQDVYPDPCQWP